MIATAQQAVVHTDSLNAPHDLWSGAFSLVPFHRQEDWSAKRSNNLSEATRALLAEPEVESGRSGS